MKSFWAKKENDYQISRAHTLLMILKERFTFQGVLDYLETNPLFINGISKERFAAICTHLKHYPDAPSRRD